jgi:hypothetical protein
VPQMTPKELEKALRRIDVAMIVTVRTRTEPKMRKTDNPFYGDVYKYSVLNGIVNFHYQKAVNRQRSREGVEPDFESQPRAWGSRISGCPLVVHQDKLYLEIKVEHERAEYRRKDGSAVSHDNLKPFIPERHPGRQGVEKVVVLRDVNLDNILSITYAGESYDVVPDAHVPDSATVAG